MSAFIGSRNLGDEAIFRSILSNLDIDKQQITALSINEEKTRQFGVNTTFAKRLPNLIRGIKNCDVFIVGGGGIIQDQSSILNFFYYAFQLWLAKHHKKPVILNFVGVGPIKFGISKWILRQIVPRIDYSIVRDEKSKNNLINFGADPAKVYQAHDPVLNFPFDKNELEDIYSDKEPYAVLSLRRWFFTNPFLPVFITRNLNRLSIFRRRYTEYMTQLAQDLDKFLESTPDIKLVAVSLYDGEDDVVNADLLTMMKHSDRVVVAPRKMDEYRYLSIVKDARFIIGMRLHSLILGSTLAKPFVALRYSAKVDEFAEQMGLTEVSIHVERYDSDRLQQSLKKMNQDYRTYADGMKDTLEEYQKNNLAAFAKLNQKIKSYL